MSTSDQSNPTPAQDRAIQIENHAVAVDNLYPEEFLPLLAATLRDEGKALPREPAWHDAVDSAEWSRGGDYPDEEREEHAYGHASACLQRAADLIRMLPPGTNLDTVRASLLAHAAAAAQNAQTPAMAGCVYCERKYPVRGG